MIFRQLQTKRRFLLSSVGALLFTPFVGNSEDTKKMWGMISKITLVPGAREEMIEILKNGAARMPGCLNYVVAKDAADENTLWVTEVWDSVASHDASLSLPVVKDALSQGKAFVTNFEKIGVMNPVWGVGLPVSRTR